MKQAQNIRFVVTLDADTNLPPDAVKELVGTMLHPLNRPVIDAKRHCVSEGYGVLQPRVAPRACGGAKDAVFAHHVRRRRYGNLFVYRL